jgi:D-inositol-3-phosphate glycosyltransferase
LQPRWKKFLASVLRPVLAFIDIRLSRLSDRIVVNSSFTAGMVERTYSRKADVIAYPAIDEKVFYPEAGVRREAAIITVAKLSRFKRVDFLLRVFSLLQKKHPQFTYHIVGQGEDEEKLKKLTRELQISDRVVFQGGVDNGKLAALHRRSMLFLHGSIEEPFGMAPLEAIACNTPVIAHCSGGPLEYVNDNCGRLIDSLSEEKWSVEISDFLLMLATDPDYFEGVSINSGKFSWESTLEPVINLISDSIPQLSTEL